MGLFDPVNTMLGGFDSAQQASPESSASRSAAPRRTNARRARSTIQERHLWCTTSTTATAPAPTYSALRRDLELRAGQRLTIVGTTGSGKSTPASLIAGLRLPSSGRITLGGTDTADLATPTPDGRRRIMPVTQEHHQFLGTVAVNLRLARRDASASDLTAALAAVAATGWTDALPDGIDTPVGTGGVNLTPRQTRQLALVRALLLDPEAAVMDEATAEDGSDTAQALDRAALAATGGAVPRSWSPHRLSQAATADVKAVMDDSKVIERRRPDELWSTGGIYARLWAAWSRGTE